MVIDYGVKEGTCTRKQKKQLPYTWVDHEYRPYVNPRPARMLEEMAGIKFYTTLKYID